MMVVKTLTRKFDAVSEKKISDVPRMSKVWVRFGDKGNYCALTAPRDFLSFTSSSSQRYLSKGGMK